MKMGSRAFWKPPPHTGVFQKPRGWNLCAEVSALLNRGFPEV